MNLFDMSDQPLLFGKCLPANVALEGSQFLVDRQNVSRQPALLRKGFVAKAAVVDGLLPHPPLVLKVLDTVFVVGG